MTSDVDEQRAAIRSVLDPDLRTWLTVASWTVWVAFALDFGARLVLAEDRITYAVRHWYDVALIALPMLRPLRLLRLLALMRILNRTAVGSLAGKVTTYVIGAVTASIAAWFVSSVDRAYRDTDATPS